MFYSIVLYIIYYILFIIYYLLYIIYYILYIHHQISSLLLVYPVVTARMQQDLTAGDLTAQESGSQKMVSYDDMDDMEYPWWWYDDMIYDGMIYDDDKEISMMAWNAWKLHHKMGGNEAISEAMFFSLLVERCQKSKWQVWFCRPLFREAPIHGWFHHHPLCWMSSLSLYTFRGFPMVFPQFSTQPTGHKLSHPGPPRRRCGVRLEAELFGARSPWSPGLSPSLPLQQWHHQDA